MSKFIGSFADCFKTKSANDCEIARRYVGGLLSQTPRKNMERIDERLGIGPSLDGDTYQATQQFISTSAWDEGAVYARIAQRANERLGGSVDSVLSIDESCHAKKGTASVGVARQYNGRLGKQDNCQVGVYSSLGRGERVCLTGARLYLPKEWCEDRKRCRKAGVPEERIEQGLLTKIDLAYELIDEALANGVKFGCVAMDSFYDRDGNLRWRLTQRGLIYCADVPSNARVFPSKPAGQRRPKEITKHTVSVGELALSALADPCVRRERVLLRNGDDGPVEADVAALRVWEWGEDCDQPEELWLVVRRMPDGSLKHSLSNAGERTALKRLARWQAARFWIERCFQDAKSHCGMSQYQARGWRAWHHHMAMVALAILFAMEERMSGELGLPGLTDADIVELMEWALVKRPTEAERIARIERRHHKREESARRKREAALKRKRESEPTI